jgi:pimeloyl-ACP methyl ester carboxylesterase
LKIDQVETGMKSNGIGNRRRVGKKQLVVLILVAILCVGVLYEYIGEWLDKNNYPPVGRIVPVNGHNMHIFLKGSGDTTVVFASGWKIPCPYADFYPLWSEISKYARIAVYDRPGYGWSDVTDVPRNIDNIVQEIHELLEKSGEKPPYILVGHSIGSLEVIRFTQRYPSEVKGVLLIDGSNPDMYSDVNMAKSSTLLYVRVKLSNWAIYISNRIGLTRLLFRCGLYSSTSLSTARNNWASAPLRWKDMDAMMFLRLFNNKNQMDEGDNKESNASKVASDRHLNIPLTIVTSQYLRNYNDAWKNQVGLKNWSDTSKHIEVDGAGHAVHWTHPNIVNREIFKTLEMKN